MDEKTGEFCLHDSYAAFEKGIFNGFKESKKLHPNLQSGLSIGGWNHRHQLKLIMRNPKEFVMSLAEFVKLHGFDFVDIDWEFDNSEAAIASTPMLMDFTKMLHDQLQNDSIYVTMALSGSTHYLKSVAGFQPYVKMFNLMTYNYSGPWSSAPSPFAPLYQVECVDAAVQCLLAQGVAPDKIVIGLSGFGVLFKDGSAQNVSKDYNELKRYRQSWDAQKCCTNYQLDSELLSIESPRSFQAKLDYAKELGLGGVFFWDIAAFNRLMHKQKAK